MSQNLDLVLAECLEKAQPTNRFFMAGTTLIEEFQHESLGYGWHQRVVLENASAESLRAYFGVPTPAPEQPVLVKETGKHTDGSKKGDGNK
mgnify:CR=1 FL=1